VEGIASRHFLFLEKRMATMHFYLTNVVTGQNAAWNDVFGDRFLTLQNKNNQLINRIGKDPVSLAFGNSEIGISRPAHFPRT